MSFSALLSEHQRRYPVIEAQNAYKLIYQVTCGPGHAVTDRTAAGHWLKTEVLNLNEPHPEPIVDSINPDGSLVRALLVP